MNILMKKEYTFKITVLFGQDIKDQGTHFLFENVNME